MIRLNCTACKATLEIDDAFAGGVCRCQHCGTIQTVPKTAQAGQVQQVSKTLFQNKARTSSVDIGGSGTGLDELGSIVTSSGLNSGRLKKSATATSDAESATGVATKKTTKLAAKKLNPIFIGGAFVALVLLTLIVLFAMRRDDSSTSSVNPGATGGTSSTGSKGGGSTGTAVSSGIVGKNPNFCGIALGDSPVIYLLDHGNATQDYFGALKETTYKSIASLGTGRKFQIILWSGDDALTYPDQPAEATADNLTAAKAKFEESYAFGQTEIIPSLKQAIAGKPATIIIATGKGYDLNEEWAKSVEDALGGSSVIIHTIALGGSGDEKGLKTVSEKTGGTYLEVSAGEIKDFSR